MKKLFFLIAIIVSKTLMAQNVGIGTTTPLARLHVKDSSVLFSASGETSLTPGNPPISGEGRRMMWYVDKAAFRAGYVYADNWNNDNVGEYSMAFGYDNRASGFASVAQGRFTTASGPYSTAIGRSTTASASNSTAMGYQTISSGIFSTAIGGSTTASGYGSTAMGENTIASGQTSTAMGGSTIASGQTSTAMGAGTTASGFVSTAMGYGSVASGDFSISMGKSTTAKSGYEIVLGSWNTNYTPLNTFGWNDPDRLFVIGNGTSTSSRSDAIVVLKNGNTGIGISNPNAPLAFANNTGPKISLYESGTNTQYGFAVQPGQLQLYSDNPAAKISFGYYVGGTFTERMFLTNSTGILTVAGTNYPSDARYKKQITPLQNPLEKIMAINGVEYFMRTDEFPSKHFDDKLQVGLLAQEVEKVLPQVVQTGADGYKAIDYAKVVPLLVEGIKEQQREIDELKKLVQQLMSK